jgi:uroporphyrinogen-III synthase
MTGPRILVTRPQPGAERTAERLRMLGFEPVVMPLTETVALLHALPEMLPDLVVATSPQAFRHLSGAAATALSAIPVRVTGKATAAAARLAGFTEVKETGGDAARLMHSISPMLNPGLRILYLAGRVRRPELEHHLAIKGVALSVIEVYETVPVSYTTDNFLDLQVDGAIAAVLLTSVNCAIRLSALAATDEINQPFENTKIICLSERIAAAAEALSANALFIAPAPSEDALMDCLAAALSQT